MMRVRSIVAALIASATTVSAGGDLQLTVRIHQARSDGGRVLIAVYDSAAGFPGGGHPTRSSSTPIHEGRAETDFSLPPGIYAVSVVHDENDNERLDTGFLGIPKEGIGASNDAQGRFGPARFEAAKLSLSRDTTIDVRLVYVR